VKKTLLTLALACQGVSLIAAPPDAASQPGASPQSSVGLQELDLSGLKQGYGVPQINKSVAGKPLSIGGRAFEKGLSRQLGRAGARAEVHAPGGQWRRRTFPI